eukprot:6569466-Alexandrium_andersonii.AAC.1
MPHRGELRDPRFHHEWGGIVRSRVLVCNVMTALHVPIFFDNLGHSNATFPNGGGRSEHQAGHTQRAISYGQGEEAWNIWKAGVYGDITVSAGVLQFAMKLEEIRG